MDLENVGWTADRQAEMDQAGVRGGIAARVSAAHRGAVEVWCAEGRRTATLAGALRHAGGSVAVGDWVVVQLEGGSARVAALLPRRSALCRKAAGRAAEAQVVAANLDVVFVVTSCDGDVSARRVERYLTAVWDGGALPVVLLNKVDLVDAPEPALAALAASAPGVEVLAVSAAEGDGLASLAPYLWPGATVALVGSSGVGKSTLVNRLAGEALPTQPLGVDARGQHTTTHRELFMLPGGAMVIDTPGMRELGLLDADDGHRSAFADIEALAAGCRFRDCGHDAEPGCAVAVAVERGELPPDRLRSFHKLGRELERAAEQIDGRAMAEARRRRRVFAKSCRERMKMKNR